MFQWAIVHRTHERIESLSKEIENLQKNRRYKEELKRNLGTEKSNKWT